MRPLGFSTGALAKGDFILGITLQQKLAGVDAIELSALRDSELATVMRHLPKIDLSRFVYVSFHAPSTLSTWSEGEVVAALAELPADWPVVVHPDAILSFDEWRKLGRRVCIENMDDRKKTGRSVDELTRIFDELPEARFCLDLGHAHQIDPTMGLAAALLREHGSRLAQIHLSEVRETGEHTAVGDATKAAFRSIREMIPDECAVIIESPVTGDGIGNELATAREIFGGELGIRLDP